MSLLVLLAPAPPVRATVVLGDAATTVIVLNDSTSGLGADDAVLSPRNTSVVGYAIVGLAVVGYATTETTIMVGDATSASMTASDTATG